MKTRMRFTKTGSVKFIGHLDCMRFFQKAIRRAKLDVAYSKGYSPHQIMSFASPLGVGITSDGEYIDIEFNSLPDMSKEELIKYMNSFMTEEIYIRDIEIMPDNFKNSMSLLEKADYLIVQKEDNIFSDNYEKEWIDFIQRDTIEVLKKTKKSEKIIDIKPYIYKWAFTEEDFINKTGEKYLDSSCQFQNKSLYMQLASGSETNIKPDLVLSTFFDYTQTTYNKYSLQIHRLQMYFKEI